MLRAAALAVAGVCLAGSAAASVEVKVKTTSYSISGKNGKALLRAMNRKGPRYGFTTRLLGPDRLQGKMEVRLAEKIGYVPYCRWLGGRDDHVYLSRSLSSYVLRSSSSLESLHGRGASA